MVTLLMMFGDPNAPRFGPFLISATGVASGFKLCVQIVRDKYQRLLILHP